MATPSEESEKAKKNLENITEIVGAIGEGFRELTSRLTDVVDEIKDGSDELNAFNNITKDITRSLRSMSKVNEELIKNQIKLNQGKLSSKDIDNQINKATSTRQVLMGRLESLQRKITEEGTATAHQQEEILKLQSAINEISQEVIDNFKKQKEEAKKLENILGSTGKILKGITKIPIVGQMVDVNAALQAATTAAQNGAGKFGAMGAALKSVGTDILKNLTDPLTIAISAITGFYKLLVSSDEATAELAKGMNMSYKDASKLREQYADIKNSAHDSYVTIQGIQESQLAIAQTLGSTAKLNEQDLITFTKLRDQAGYTNEELAQMQRLTLAVGGSLEDNVRSFAGTVAKLNLQNKLTINEKQLLKDVSKVSDAIKLSVGGTAESIATAAFKAKQFGISLEQADKISEGLLNFEESMTNEISAQLLTGKDINLEHARLLALNGDIAGASAEILSQVGGVAEFSKMNRIQQEAISKAVGLSRDELAKSLVEREALQKIGAKDAEEAEKNLRARAAVVGWEKAIAESKDEAYAKQLAQNAISEDYNKIVQELKELFIPIAQELLPKIKDFLKDGIAPIVESIKNNFDLIVNVVKVLATIIGINMVAGMAKNIASMVTLIAKAGVLVGKYTAMATAWAIANPVAAAAGLALAAGIGAAIYSQMEDGAVNSSGLIVGKYNKGQIQPIAQGAPEDNVIFTTNKPTAAPASVNSNNSELVREMRETKEILNNLLSTNKQIAASAGLSVVMDSTRVGTAVNIGTYSVQ